MRLLPLAALALAVASSACGHSPGGAEPGADAPAAPDASNDAVAAATCSGLDAISGNATWTVMSSGVPRLVNIHVPVTYDPTKPTALVLNFHGFTSDGIQEDVLTLMDPKADDASFIVMYPIGTGVPLSWNAGACCGTAAATGVDDVQFVRDLLDTAAARLCIDAKRTYATGMSNGGFLSHRLGCELADRIAAIAPVAGVLGVPTCAPSRPVPVMHFHGTSDPLVPWAGSTALGFISVSDSFTGWATRDGCTGAPVTTYENGDASCRTYQHCTAGAEVTLCTIVGGGHTWPGGTPVPALGLTSTDISATDAMWTFFTAHPMP